VKHSLNVYHVAKRIAANMRELCPHLQIPEESIIIASLLHDLCKATRYHHSEEVMKEDGTIRKTYIKDYDHFPIGHGEKSVIQLLRWGLELTEDEMLAIRYHMGNWQLSMTNEEVQRDYREACIHHPLIAILHTADTLAAQIIETQ
jgi:HD superfamily phosphohydrolase